MAYPNPKTRSEMSEEINDQNGTITFSVKDNYIVIYQDDDTIYVGDENIPALITALQKIQEETK